MATTSGTAASDQLHKRDTLYSGRMITLCVDSIETDDGVATTREVILHPGACAIVPVTADGSVVFVRQWRQALGRYLIEIPAGCIEPDEDPAICAARELEEETGFRAELWQRLGTFSAAPGYSNELLHLYLASHMTTGLAHTDEDESVEVLTLGPQDIADLIRNDELDMKSIAALALAGYLPQETVLSATS